MFRTALTSRLWYAPHSGQVHWRTERSLTSEFLYPHLLQSCEDAYQRSTFKKSLPARFILYCTIVRNRPHPTDDISLARQRFFTMPLIFRSSQINTLHRSAILRLNLWWKSFLWFASFRCSFATLMRAFSQFFEPVCVVLSYCFLDNSCCRRRRRFACFWIHLGFSTVSASVPFPMVRKYFNNFFCRASSLWFLNQGVIAASFFWFWMYFFIVSIDAPPELKIR